MEEQEEVHQFPDGSLHSFPMGTDPLVIKNEILKTQGLIQSPSEKVRALENKYTPGNVTIAQKVAPYVPTGAGILGGVAGGAAGSPLLGSVLMSAITNLLQPKPKDESHGFALDTATDTAWNEALGPIIKGIAKGGVKVGGGVVGALAPEFASKFKIPSIDESLLKLKPTYSQLSKSGLAKIIENTFAASAKKAAIKTTSDLTKEEAANIISKISGQSLKLNEGEILGEGLQKQVLDTYKSYKNVSNLRGNAAKGLAENGRNTQQIPIFKIMPNPNNAPALPGAMPQMVPTGGSYAVTGAVIPTNTIKEVQQIFADMDKSHIKPDPNDPVIKKLNDILDSVYQTDPETGEKYYKPAWSFGDAWETKKVAGDIGYEGVNTANQTIHDVRFQRIAKAVDSDIENSIKNSGLWHPQDGPLALNNYQESKHLTQNRYDLFGATNQTGSTIKDLVKRQIKGNGVQSPVNVLNDIADDPVKLAQFLNSDKTPISKDTKTQYIFDNKRKDMAAYQVMRMFNNSLSGDATDASNQVFDPAKFTKQLNPSDARTQQSLKILFSSQNRADLEQFGKNLAMTTQKGEVGARPYWYLKLASNGLGMTAGLLTGATSSLPGGAAIIGGTIGLNGLGRLLTNPDSARLMVSLANNGPLNMSLGMAGRVIANVLKNQDIALKYADGTEVNARFGPDGKLGIPIGEKK